MFLACLAFCTLTAAEPAPPPAFAKFCAGCHGGAKSKGDFDLTKLHGDFAKETTHWEAVLERLHDGSMPPEGKPKPTASEAKALRDYVTDGLANATKAKSGAEGRTVLRRLNRVEYETTLRDLFDIHLDVRDRLPEETSALGFYNIGEALHLSPAHLERYLEAADMALDAATASKPKPDAVKARMTYDYDPAKRNKGWLYKEDAVVFFNSGYSPTELRPMAGKIIEPGLYRLRISAYAHQSQAKPMAVSVHGLFLDPTKRSPLFLGEFQIPEGKPTVIEIVARFERGELIKISPQRNGYVNNIVPATYAGPGVAVEWIDLEGPLGIDAWPPPGHRRLWGDLPLEPTKATAKSPKSRQVFTVVSKEPAKDAERLLKEFLPVAYRRPTTDSDLKPVLALVNERIKDGYSFEEAMRVGYKRILCSPDFLFLREKSGPLDDFALAARLSYFLWSSLPDDELTKLAKAGTLRKPDVLKVEVERMLKDPKAERFAENFCGQWLDLRRMDFTAPDMALYPEFDEALRAALPKETLGFFLEVLKNDLPIASFVDSDWTILNDRLAKHYGIPGVEGPEFRKVKLPPGCHRGGVMTHAAVLKVTANGTTTSPVVRGKWISERILGRTIQPPPPDIPAVEPDIRGATTIRDQLAKHRAVETCAGCHRKIDPPGFALENYDPVGGWRDNYRSLGAGMAVNLPNPDGSKSKVRYKHGLEVDAGDKLADGREFRNLEDFKKLVLAEPESMARGLAERLVAYATGSPPSLADKPDIDALLKSSKDGVPGLKSLVRAIVQSPLFQTK